MTTDPTPPPRAGDRWIEGPDLRGNYKVVEQTAVQSPVTGRCEVVVAEYLSRADALLLAHGRGHMKRLRVAARDASLILRQLLAGSRVPSEDRTLARRIADNLEAALKDGAP